MNGMPTPCLLLDVGILERNIAAFRAKLRRHDLSFRPHMKTAKSIDVLNRVVADGNAKISVSTISEARYFIDHGVTDICYTLPVTREKIAQLVDLQKAGAHLTVFVDTPQVARDLAAQAAQLNIPLRAVIEIDADGNRGGVTPDSGDLVETAAILWNAHDVEFGGVYVFAGMTYMAKSPDQSAQFIEQCRRAALNAIDKIQTVAPGVTGITIGGSAVAQFAKTLEGVTEICAGVFMFQDLFQAGLELCSINDIAVSVLATVVDINYQTKRVFIDAGALALSQDRSTASQINDMGYGMLVSATSGTSFTDLFVQKVSQEHGHIMGRNGADPTRVLSIGDKVRVLPNHVCMTAAAHNEYQLTGMTDTTQKTWARHNGW